MNANNIIIILINCYNNAVSINSFIVVNISCCISTKCDIEIRTIRLIQSSLFQRKNIFCQIYPNSFYYLIWLNEVIKRRFILNLRRSGNTISHKIFMTREISFGKCERYNCTEIFYLKVIFILYYMYIKYIIHIYLIINARFRQSIFRVRSQDRILLIILYTV